MLCCGDVFAVLRSAAQVLSVHTPTTEDRCDRTCFQVHPDYDSQPTPGGIIVPHGISVVISAPSIFRFTAVINPERHLRCAELLGADVSNAKSTGDYAGNLLADEILKLMDATGVPMGANARLSCTADMAWLCLVLSCQQANLTCWPAAAELLRYQQARV